MPGLFFASGIDSGFEKRLTEMQAKLNSFTNNNEKETSKLRSLWSEFGSTITGVVGVAALAKAGKELVTFSMDLETALTEVSTVSGEVTNNFEKYKETMLAMSTQSKTSAIDLTKAFYDIVSAGYDGQKGLDILKASQDASVAGFVDVGVAADGLTTVINAWGKEASEAGQISDVFFKSVELGKTTFPELASNIAQVAPLAASMGVSFEEMAGAVATLTKKGTPTSEALTQIRSSLLATTKVLGDGWAETMTYQEAMQAIADKAGGSTNKLTDMMGRVEAVNAVLALTGNNAAGAASDLEAMNVSLGATAKAASKVEASTAEQVGMLKNNILASLEPLGDSVKEVIAGITEKLNKAFESGKIQQYAKILMQLVKVFLTYKVALIALNQMQRIRAMLIEQEIIAMRVQAQTGKQVSAANVMIGRSMKSLSAAFAANPIGLLVTGLTLALPAIIKASKAFETAGSKMEKINDEINKTVAEETSGLEVLRRQLNSNNISTETKKKLIEQLNEQYGQYLPHLLTEKSSQEEINKAIKEANVNLSKQIRLRVLQQKAQETASRIYELETDIEDKKSKGTTKFLAKIMGGYATANIVLGRNVAELLNQKDVYEKLINEIGGLTEEAAVESSQAITAEAATSETSTKELTDKDKKAIRDAALKRLEIENQTRINGLAEQYEGQEAMEDDYNKKLLENRLWYLEKLRKLTTDELEKLKIDEEMLKTKATLKQDPYLKEALEQFQTYTDKKNSIEKQYQKKIDLLRSKGYEDQAKEAEKAMDNEIENLNEQVLSNSKIFQDWEDSLPSMVKKGLNFLTDQLSNLKVKIQTENLSPEEIIVYTAEIEKLENEIDNLNGKTEDNKKSWEDVIDVLNNVEEFINNVIGSFEGADESTKAMLESVGAVVGGIVTMGQSIKALSTSLSTLEKASVILAIIAAAIKLVNALVQYNNKQLEITRQNYINELEKVQQINLALIEQNKLYEEGNEFFSDDKWGTALKGLQAYNQALIYQQELVQNIADSNSEITKNQEGIYEGNMRKTSFGSGSKETKQMKAINEQAKNYSTALEQALAGIDVKTDNKSSFANFFGIPDTYKSLLSLYPDLVDANGQLNTSLLKTLLETEDISEVDKERLTNLIETAEAAEEAYAQFGEYISSIFGSVGDDITQAFQNMYTSGEDAMMSLEASFSDMIESFTRDAIEFAILQPILDELNNTTKAIGEQYAAGEINAEQLQSGIIDSLGGFYSSLSTIQPEILKAFESADKLAAEAGFDSAFNNTDSTSSSSSVAGQVSQSITEETGSMLVGRMGAIMLSNERIANYSEDMLDYAIQNLVTLNKIKENTDYLPVIADNTRKTYEKLEMI